jgi:hypothetical protein
MILYNVTVSIDEQIKTEWLAWMQEKHIPDVMQTGMFMECRISRIHAEEEGGLAYAISYLCKDKETYDRYQEEFAPALQREHGEKFAGKFAAFRTLLEVINEFK